MADKHFSDPSRHAVKNPLLSSAVTGVSIEDLTQHAVLLPVVRANVQDSESHTAETITNRPPNFRNAISKPIDDSVPSKPKMESNLRDAQPNNDLKKDQDDFDVNEYFARLQGMKYVSAPLNSNLDGDKLKSEAVLESESEDVDSNFSEINLRDDSQSTSDVPADSGQSLTADLAQNFSQLPQVLPQVASAVFSSFSNILNRNILNSKVEQNEALKPTDYSNHSYGPAASNMMGSGDFEPVSESYDSSGSVQVDPVPMLNAVDYSVPGANAALSVTQKLDAPRPPDTGVANNFRLTSRKKHYAQIPGLRSGEIVDTSQTYVPQIPQLAGMPPRPPSVPHTDPLIPMIPIESQSQRVLNQATCNLPSMDPNKPRQPSKPHGGHLMGTTESQSQSTFLNQNTFNLEPLAPGPTTTPLVPHSKSTMIPSESPPQRFILNQPSTLNQENYPIPNSSISHNVPFIPKELNAGSHIPSLPPQTASSKPTEYKSSVMVLEPPISMKELIQNPFDYVKSSEPSLSVLNTQVQVPFTVAEPTELNAVNNRKPSILPNNPPMFETPSSLHCFSEKPNALTENVPFIISTENSNNLERSKIANANVSGNITMPPNSNTSSSFKTHVLFQNTEVMPSVNSTDLSNMISGFSEMDSSDSKCNQPTFFNPQSVTDKETDKPPKNFETPPAQSNIFRLQNKKRPQYYSGPIVDKSGLLLDNLIPEMVKRDTKPPSPFVPPSVMQEPAFITPENSIFKPEFPESNFSNSNASVFDLNAQHAQPDCLGLDSNLSQVQNIDQDNAGNQNIGSTDVFGSFKSKLSAIKLDRIQNAVTTFFDPSFYNKDKKDDDSKNVNFQNYNSSINNQSGISSFDNSNQNMFNTVPLETVSDSYQNVDQSNSQHLYNPTITTIAQNSISFFNPPTQQTAEIPFSNSSMQHQGNNFSNSLQSESFYNPLQYSHGQITHSEMQQTELSSDNAVPQQSVSFYNPVQYSNETNTTLNLSSGSQKILLDDNKAVTNKSNFVGQQFQISHDMKKSLDIQPNISDNLSSSGFYNPLNYTNTNSNVQTNHVEIQQPQLSDDKSDLQNVPFYNPVDYLHETQLRTDFISNSQPVLIGCNEEVARLSNFDVQQSNVSVDLQRKRSLDLQPQENDNSNFPGFYNPLNYRDTKTNEQYPDIQIQSSNAGQSDYSTNVLFYNPKEYSNATNTIATDKESVGIHNKHTDNLYPTEFYHPLNYSMTSTGVSNVDLDSNSGQTHFNITENISLFNPLDYSKIEPDEVKLIKSDTSNITDLSKDIPTYNPLNYIEQQTQEQSLEQPQQSDNSNISDFYNPLNYSNTKADDQNQTEQSDFSTNVLFYSPMEYSDASNRKPDLSSNEKATKKESVEVYNKHTVNSYPTEFTNNSRQTHFNVMENISLFNPSDYSEIKQDGTKLDESDTSYNNNLSMDITTYNPLNYTEQQSRKEIDSCFETQLTEHVSPSGQSQSGIKTSVPPLVPSYNPSPYLQTAESQSIDVAMQSKQNSQSNIATNIPHKVSTSDPSQYSSREAVEGQANVALCDDRLHPIHNEESSLKKPLFDLQDSVLKNAETTENVTFYSPVECAQKTFIVDPTLKDKFDPHRSETDFTEEMTALDDNLNSTEAYKPSELNPGKILDLENPTANITLYNPLEHYRNSNAESSEILIHNSNVKHSYTSQNIDFVKSSIKSDITECKDEILSESTSEIKDKLRNISFYDPQTLCQNISDLLPGVDTENSFVTSESYISFNPENAIEQIENTKERKLDNPLSFFESNFTDSFNLKTQRSLNTDSGTEREEKALSSSAEVTNDSIDLVDRTPIDETIKITKTQNLHSNVPNSEGMYSSIINYSNLDLDANRQEYPPVVPQEQFYVDFSTETKTLESESANKRPMDHETNITNEYKVDTVERPLHLDLPTNASDEVKAGFHQAMSPEDIEELSTQLSLTNMKEDNLRDYDVPPTAPPAEEFDHLECELKNLNKSSTEVAKEDVEEISSTTDDYKLANVIELDSNTEKNIGDTEGVNPTTPISFASYFDTGNFAVENHFKNSPLKQESESFISESIPIVNNSITSSSAELNTVLQADPLQFFGSMPPTTIKTEHTENNWLSNYFGQTTSESVSLGVSLEKAEPSVSESTSVNADLFFHLSQDQNFFPDPPKTQPLIQSSQPLIPENQDIASDFYLTQDHNYYTQETKASESLNNQALCHLTIDNKSLKEPASADHTYQFSVPQLALPYQNYLPNFSYDQDQNSMQNPTLSSSFNVLRQNQDYNSKPVDSLNDPKDQQKSSFFHLTEDHNYFVDPEITSNMSETHRVLKNHTSVVYQSNLSSIDNSFNPFCQKPDHNYYAQSDLNQTTDSTEKSVFHLNPDHNYFTIGDSTENQSYISVNKLVPQETHIPNQFIADEKRNFFDVNRLIYDRHKMPTYQQSESNAMPSLTVSSDTNVISPNSTKIKSSVELRGQNEYSSFEVKLDTNDVDCHSNLRKLVSNSATNLDPANNTNQTDTAAAKDNKNETCFSDLKVFNDCSKCRGLIGSYIGINLEADFFENSSEDIMDAEGGNSEKTGAQGSRSDEVKNTSPGSSKQKGSNRTSVTFEDIGESEEEQTLAAEDEKPQYKPVTQHWFYRIDQDGKSIWRPFSQMDSEALEEAYNSPTLNEDTLVATDGGRYDVNVMERKRSPIYWTDKSTNVRRCSWFYKGTTDARYVPYPEQIAERLEEEYRLGVTRREWHRRVELPGGESVVLHGPSVMVHFLQQSSPDAWGNTPQTVTRPRVVKRGLEEFDIDNGESSRIDHLLLLVHGIGSVCDLRFRSVEEVVDEFRAISLQLVQSHYKEACEKGQAGRVEVLPVSWHSTLHSPETGIDKLINLITLDSIPKLRNFTNDTLLDVLFYTSPVFCQTIMDTVGAELNRIYSLFQKRNPSFQGGIALGGHSLGSLIIFDLLCHQRPDSESTRVDSAEQILSNSSTDDSAAASPGTTPHGKPECSSSHMLGSAGTGQPFITYPALGFEPSAFFALGSPIGMFECVRGVEALGEEFSLPTCPAFFNIFHPYDPVAYRIEPLINPELKDLPPLLIPHHKGRKRMHLELKDTMLRVGTDIKQRLVESIRSTWASVWRAPQPPAPDQLQKVVQEQLDKAGEVALNEKQEEEEDAEKPNSEEEASCSSEDTSRLLTKLGRLNGGRRVDHVLQEAPFEMINEYLFAMTSHVCYWESEDTMLLVLREIYSSLGVSPDRGVPQQTLTLEVERPAGASTSGIVTKVSSQSDNNIQFVREQTRHHEDLSSKRKPDLVKPPRSSLTEQ